MEKEIKYLQKNEEERIIIVRKIKNEIKKKRGDLHDWEYHSFHHNWTYWYKCKLCNTYSPLDIELTDELKKEKCQFFNNDSTYNLLNQNR